MRMILNKLQSSPGFLAARPAETPVMTASSANWWCQHRGSSSLPIRTTLSVVRHRPTSMIVLKISNASEVVASKVGRFLERLTPDSMDNAAVEDQVIQKLVENLAAEGLKGEIAAINGLDLSGDDFSVNKGLKVRKHSSF